LGEAIKFPVEHAHEVIVGIRDDSFCDPVPQHGNGESSPIVRIGSLVGLAEELESVNGIERMARSFAEGPAPLVADRIHDRHADDVLEFLEFPHNDGPMGPGAGPGDIEVVPSSFRLVAGTTVRSYPACKGIRLPDEATLDVLLVGKLCLNGHRRIST